MFGYNLHPSVPREGPSLKIADVGTGTGVWLLDLRQELDPTAELVGIDVDISQAAPKQWLPENISLREWSVFTDVPDDLVEMFDIVNLRLFSFVIENDPAPVLRKLTRLLKPGGHLQWSETDVRSCRIDTSSPDVPTDALTELWEQTVQNDPRLYHSWARDLPQVLKTEGLINVLADWRRQEGHAGMMLHWCTFAMFEMFAAKMQSTNPKKAADIMSLVQASAVETRRGAMYAFDRVLVVGQKPENC
ncbi:hypothetical protein QQS21_005388 [Conoideocrella luteorostrata]|uniref:Methyltransferase domain-containing protein n=1 Tax=Conoideocrella luteorostrata TaxID=1105319 RepID=A0AAJ0CPI1_9HYPO|nr:hypothetical protein QQS21_005388 [Conoideocrella luteorostrata]